MASEFKDLSDEQLVHRVLARERDLVTARFDHSQNQLENTSTLRVIRKDIARLRTEVRTREIAQNVGKDALLSKHRGSFGAAPAPQSGGVDRGGFLKGIVDRIATSE